MCSNKTKHVNTNVFNKRKHDGNKCNSSQNYKQFLGYMDDDYKTESLRTMPPKTNAYLKSYDGKTKQMYFSTENSILLEKRNDIQNKVHNSMKKEVD